MWQLSGKKGQRDDDDKDKGLEKTREHERKEMRGGCEVFVCKSLPMQK